MVETLADYINNSEFDNQKYNNDTENTVFKANPHQNKSNEYMPNNVSVPEPVNQPTANGYQTNLIFAHPDKINDCDVTNLAPMNYYSEINSKLNNNIQEKVMNGGHFGEVTGFADDEELYYY